MQMSAAEAIADSAYALYLLNVIPSVVGLDLV